VTLLLLLVPRFVPFLVAIGYHGCLYDVTASMPCQLSDGTSSSFILSTVLISDLMLSSLFPQDNLLEIVQLVGKESLSEDQKVSLHVQRCARCRLIRLTYGGHNPNHPLLPSFFTLSALYSSSYLLLLTHPLPSLHLPKVIMDIADMIIEDFLYQNVFTTYDYFCPLPKSVSMCVPRSSRRTASRTSILRFSPFICLCSSYRSRSPSLRLKVTFAISLPLHLL
jgi:hypothetical protein